MKGRRKNMVVDFPISKQIDYQFREYALYVLENRGIPAFGDGMTNVQRIIMQNSPSQYNKTLSLIGSCFSAGYAHGDKSLESALAKMARPYGNSVKMLEGDGFFGNPINHTPAASRYTKVRSNSEIWKIISENNFLNSTDEEGKWDPFFVDVPIGLVNTVIGIAVGYKTTILPRSIDDMRKFMRGEIKEVHPKFQNFSGKITRYQNLDKSWLIEGVTEINPKARIIKVVEIPPLMKYSSFLKKLDKVLLNYEGKYTIKNDSSKSIDMTFLYKGRSGADFLAFAKIVNNATKMIVTETPVFIKDGIVLEYKRIEDYLKDFKYRIAELNWKRSEYYMNQTDDELEFQKAKKLFMQFMLSKKRIDSEIDEFLEPFPATISRRLNALYMRYLTKDELKRTTVKIKELQKELKKLIRVTVTLEKRYLKLNDPTAKRGIITQSKNLRDLDLFGDDETVEIDGVEVYMGDEELNELENDE